MAGQGAGGLVARLFAARLLRLSLVLLLPLLFGAICLCAAGVLGVVSHAENKITLDNGFDVAVIVTVDDDKPFLLDPFDDRLIRPSSGEHRLIARGPDGAVVEEGRFLVGEGASAARGFLGVYNLGGKRQYAVVPRLSPNPHDEPDLAHFRRVTPPARFFSMPPEVTSAIVDGYFYPNRPPADQIFDGHVRLCHFDPATRALGCRLCPGSPSRCTSTDDSDARPLIAP